MLLKKIYITILVISGSISLNAQIGINTESPRATLEVNSLGANSKKALKINNSDNEEVVSFLNSASIGLGVSTPNATADTRSSKDAAVGIGYTSQTAADAKEGAIRYNTGLDMLQYSNGTTWINLNSEPLKLNIVATNDFGQKLDSASTNIISNWSIFSADNDLNSFDGTSGYFTAPRDGIYSFTVTCTVEYINLDGPQIELNLVGMTTEGNNLLYKSALVFTDPKTYSSANKGISTITNKAYVPLKKGDTMRVGIYQRLSTNMFLMKSKELNTLTIAEL